jgi:hypothetical protein
MSLIQNTQLGAGGAGFQGSGPESAAAMLKELQGFNVSVVAGGNADTKFDLAAIRQEDTIISALNNNSGAITDITGTMSIADLRASGTVTVGAPSVGDTVTVAGLVYTVVAADTVVEPHDYSKIKIGDDAADAATNSVTSNNTNVSDSNTVTVNGKAYTFKTALSTGPTVEGEVLIGSDADESLLNLKNAINHTGTPGTDYTAAAVHPTVTAGAITNHSLALVAKTAGVAGNSLTLAKSAATLTVGGATFSGGTDAGVDETVANVVAAINGRENNRSQQMCTASANGAVITITAVAEGTSGNALTLAETGSTFTVSGATLSGGTATGGIKSSGATNQIILFWFNKQ